MSEAGCQSGLFLLLSLNSRLFSISSTHNMDEMMWNRLLLPFFPHTTEEQREKVRFSIKQGQIPASIPAVSLSGKLCEGRWRTIE